MRTLVRTLVLLAATLIGAPGFALSASQAGKRSVDAAEARQLDQQWKDRWQGRQHYLFDATDAATDAYAAANPSACGKRTVQMKRSDGKTVLRKIGRCE
jgi:hypothetical protein